MSSKLPAAWLSLSDTNQIYIAVDVQYGLSIDWVEFKTETIEDMRPDLARAWSKKLIELANDLEASADLQEKHSG